MSASERKAAQTLIANYPLIGLRTVAEFSTQAGVSSPTIFRFVSRLASRVTRISRERCRRNSLHRCNRLGTARARSRPRKTARYSLSWKLQSRIFAKPSSIFSAQQLDDVTDAISRNRARIYLLGGRFTDPIARYMAAHLKITRPGVTHLAGQESHWRDQLIDMGKKDVLIIFDIRRYQDSLIRFAEKAQARGVEIVLITDQWLSPIARFARHVIAGRTAVPSPWDSSATLFLVAETLIAEVTRKLEKSSADRIRDMEQLRDN